MQTVHVSVSHELSMKNQAYISFIRKVIYNKFGTCPLMNLIKKKKKKKIHSNAENNSKKDRGYYFLVLRSKT
jgi:sulfur relay (sulfurtransferase) DsrC/TusE family protein